MTTPLMQAKPLSPLSDHIDFITSGSRGWRRYYASNGARFVRVQNVKPLTIDFNDMAYVDPPESAEADRAQIRSGDLLVTVTGNPGVVAVAPRELGRAYVSQHVALVRLKSGIEPAYVAAFLQSEEGQSQLKTAAYGQTRAGLGLNDVRRVLIPLPPLDEQRRIVDILNRANGVRRLPREALEKTRQLVPALFVQMFGDPFSNPKGWPKRRITDVVAGFEGGRNLLAGPEGDNGTGYRILKVSAVTSGYYRANQSKPAPTAYLPPEAHFVQPGDLLFSRANTVELVGATALVYETPPNILLPDKIWRVLWRAPSPVVPEFLLSLFQHSSVRRALGKLATGTSDSMRNISKGRLSTMLVPVPPEPLQHEFADRTIEARATIAQQERVAEAADQLVATLMARTFG